LSTKDKFIIGLGAVGTLGAAGLIAKYHLDSIRQRNAAIAEKNRLIALDNKEKEKEYLNKIGITGQIRNYISKFARKTNKSVPRV
jgi:hypothetical protein